MLLRCATVHYPSTKQSKYSNCTVNPSKYGKENQGMHFHHHCQACLIHWEQTPLLMHVIQYRILITPRYFINWVKPVWPGQNLTSLTRITRPSFNPNIHPCSSNFRWFHWFPWKPIFKSDHYSATFMHYLMRIVKHTTVTQSTKSSANTKCKQINLSRITFNQPSTLDYWCAPVRIPRQWVARLH